MATINDAVRQMYLTQTGREADPGGLEYFVNRFGTSIEPDELAIFRQMAADEVAGQEARQAAAAQQQAAAQAAREQQAAQQQQPPDRAAQQQAENLARYTAEMQQLRESERVREAARVLAAQQAAAATVGTATTNNGSQATANAASNAGATGMSIAQAYQQVLGRTPSQQEIDYWTSQFGPSVDATELSTFSVAAQPERAAVPTTNNAIRQMYLSVLGREPDASGLQYFSDRFGADVDASELGIFRGMSTQEINANAARNAAVTAGTGTTSATTGLGLPGAPVAGGGTIRTGTTTAGTVQPIVRPTGPRQVTGTQLAPASFAQTAITGTPFTNLYTPSNVQQNAPRLSDIQAATQSANPYQSLMALTPQRTLSPSYAAQAGQTTANTNLGGYDSSLYSKPLTGLLAPSTVTGGGGADGVNNSGDARGPGTDNTGGIPGLNIDPVALAAARVAGLFGSSVSLGLPAPVTDATITSTQAGRDYAGASGKSSWGKSGNADQDIGGTTSGDGGGTGEGLGAAYDKFEGGLITPRNVRGPNPPGPDDGNTNLDIGEYVIRKKAVQKYGANIFEQINAGKIPAKRLKSLLE